jgi:hypothetical protein
MSQVLATDQQDHSRRQRGPRRGALSAAAALDKAPESVTVTAPSSTSSAACRRSRPLRGQAMNRIVLILGDLFVIVPSSAEFGLYRRSDGTGDRAAIRRAPRSRDRAGLAHENPVHADGGIYRQARSSCRSAVRRDDRAGQEALVVDAFARWKIVDPLRFYQTLTDQDRAHRAADVDPEFECARRAGAQNFSAVLSSARASDARHSRQHESGSGTIRDRDRRCPHPPRRSAAAEQPGDLRAHEAGAHPRSERIRAEGVRKSRSASRRAPTAK